MFFEEKNNSPMSLWEDNFDDNETGDPEDPDKPETKDDDWDEIDIESDDSGLGNDEDAEGGEEE